jgi:hypothetical protein
MEVRKYLTMRKNQLSSSIPWRLTFLLTSLCYFGIAAILKLFSESLPVIFFWIGIVTFGLGCISCIGTIITKERRSEEFSV